MWVQAPGGVFCASIGIPLLGDRKISISGSDGDGFHVPDSVAHATAFKTSMAAR